MRKAANYIFIIIMAIISDSCKAGSENNVVRPMAVAGSFYPAERDTLEEWFGEYFRDAPAKGEDIKAIIVPHAGYIFSGSTAACAVGEIDRSKHYDHIFLLGPSHRVSIDGASIPSVYDSYDSPFGEIAVDKTLCNELIEKHRCFTYNPAAHDKEHCIEVQLPLLKYWFDDMPPIVPIIIGTENYATLKDIAAALKPYFDGNNLFVISSDFSHYPSYDDAMKADKTTGDAIMTGKTADFIDAIHANDAKGYRNLATSACGQSAIAVMLMMMEGSTCSIRHLKYCNSGDSEYSDKDRVVGYHAFVVETGFGLSDADKKQLLSIARHSIEANFGKGDDFKPVLNDTLKRRCGAFVTLRIDGELRGCIGHIGEDIPLHETVGRMARAAAFEDPRFDPLVERELKDIEIEISVLTPMKRIHSIDEFVLHRDGIYIRKGWRSGTFLPQVADEVAWDETEFVSHCSQDKAGLGWDGWKDAELYTYQAIIFHE